MNPSVLRKTWAVVESTPVNTLLDLSDADLVKALLAKVVSQSPLSLEEEKSIRLYLSSKMTLIRDLA